MFSMTFDQFVDAPLDALPDDLVSLLCDDFVFSSNLTTKDVALVLHTSVPYYIDQGLHFFNQEGEVIGSIKATVDDPEEIEISWENAVARAKSGVDFVSPDSELDPGRTAYEESLEYLHKIYDAYINETTNY